MYPQAIHSWNTFREGAEGFTLDDGSLIMEAPIERIFYTSLTNAGTESCDEADEQYVLLQILDQTLRKAGIVNSMKKRTRNHGKMDFCVMKDKDNISIVCECKSTHNLLLPMTADECTATYNHAYAHGVRHGIRSIEWSNVAHPIGQLLRYMVDIQHRLGALTSGTRTYFVKIQGPDDTSVSAYATRVQGLGGTTYQVSNNTPGKKLKVNDAVISSFGQKDRRNDVSSSTTDNSQGKVLADCNVDSDLTVYISDAWFVGEANYLRAWAYMNTLHETTVQPWKNPTSWIKSTNEEGGSTPNQWPKMPSDINSSVKSSSPSDVRHSDDDYSGGSAVKGCNMVYNNPMYQNALEHVPIDEIKILDVVGEGRNGVCYKVKWKGVECAMKQFDIGRDGDFSFKREIQAYMLLQKAWGILVPQPMFISETFSGGTVFLGLQLGHESTNIDDLPKFDYVLKQLEKEFGIQHNDAECGRNMLIITDADGAERVVAIDFEDWDEVQH
jgi:predicted Ser/Thr protein kinase